MENWFVLAFVLFVILSWLLRQVSSATQEEEDSATGKGAPPIGQKLRRTFDEWSEKVSSIEEYLSEEEPTPEGQRNQITCPHCNTSLALGEEAWQRQQITCPACYEQIDLRELGYDQRRTVEASPQRTGLSGVSRSSEGRGDMIQKEPGTLYGEQSLETKRSSITEEKPISEQRLEGSQKPEQKRTAKEAKSHPSLKSPGGAYEPTSREKREVLAFLHGKENIRRAFLVMELLQPPVSMRSSPSIWQDPD